MASDSASVASFSSLDNVSRSSMLRRQREAALRRRQVNVPVSDDSSRSTYRNHTLNAMSDLKSLEEAKTRERIEARIRQEELQREEEARLMAERARVAKEEAEAERLAQLERYEQEQSELKVRLAEEQKAREEAALRLQEETRRLAETKAEADRLEKERLVAEAAKRAELERLENELKRERLEKERLARAERAKVEAKVSERARIIEQQSLAPKAEQGMLGNEEEDYGHFSHDMAGSNNGYQKYLSSFHQPAEDATIVSELTDGNSPCGSASALQAEKNATQHASDRGGSKIKRTMSTRSLSFTEVKEADNSTTTSEENDTSTSLPSKIASLQQVESIANANLDDPKVMRSFLMRPCPKGEGMVECCIRRNKGLQKALFPEYRMYLKSNNSKTETFLMTSKKRVGNKTSNYLISMNRNDHDKNSDSILGKLRSNFLGTEYVIYDQGKNPGFDDSYYDEKNDGDIRCELGAIMYAANTSLGAKGPRKMKVCIGKPDDDGNPLKVWQPKSNNDEKMMTCLKKETNNINNLVCLENKPPGWNEDMGAYVLNFGGRVTQASAKNFILREQNDEKDNQIMLFGRVGKDEFSLDVKWPMSPFQAFVIALSSCDSKLGCD